MEYSSPEESSRKNLLDRILDSVKQVQAHFGAKQEIATENDERVLAMCTEWETILTHGAKKVKPKNALRLTGRSEGVSLWPLAKLCVNPDDLQRFTRLEHLQTELGRGRAWLRASINERTLENYMHIILSQEGALRKLYEPYSFVLDQEKSSMLPVMAAGLSSIIFSITVDSASLNSVGHSVEVDPPVSSIPKPQSSTTPQSIKLSRSKDSSSSSSSDYGLKDSSDYGLVRNQTNRHRITTTAEHSTRDDEDVVAVSMKIKKNKKAKTNYPASSPEVTDQDEVSPVMLRESTSSSSSRHSLDLIAEDQPVYVDLGMDRVASDARAAATATALVLSATTEPLLPPQQMVTHFPMAESEESSNVQQFSSDSDLRNAMLTLSRIKEELESHNRQLSAKVTELDSQYEVCECELEQCRQENLHLQETHASKKLALERENDLLREQLKKYVGIVQWKGNHSEEKARSVDGKVGLDLSSSVAAQEESANSAHTNLDVKLQEMAEMYGDLMELNDRLHRELAEKDRTISLLVHLLKESNINIPIPLHQLPPAAMETKHFVDVSIPSVIKKGKGPDTHHVYQVLVCIRAVEWNVYRRYTEFREFHRQLQKHVPEITAYNFPPKKAIGNKSLQVVEERRQKLQDYLRAVIKTCSSPWRSTGGQISNAVITADISKTTLVTMFPFFKTRFLPQ